MTRRVSFFLLVLVTCSAAQSNCGYHAPPEYKKIFDLPRDQQKDEFKKLALDKQVDMYRYAMYREPPDLGYSDFLASNGKEAIPYLLQRLREEEDDYVKARLIRVFRDMHEVYYNLRNETEVIAELQRDSAKITDSLWRQESERYVETIVNKPGVSDK